MTDLAKRLEVMRQNYALDKQPMAFNTERNYRSVLKLYREWLAENGVSWEGWDYRHLMLYLAETAPGRDPMTRWQAINALRRCHPERDADTRHPEIAKLRKGLQRRKRTVGIRRAYPLTLAEVERLIAAGSEPLQHESAYQWRKRILRFEASCLLAFFGLLRVSELTSATWGDLEELADGSGRLTIRRSKTDQAGDGQTKLYPPQVFARIIRYRSHLIGNDWTGDQVAYRDAPQHGPFPKMRIATRVESFRKALNRAVELAGMGHLGITTHSFRRGAATAMADAGVPDRIISKEGRWSSPAMLDVYADAERLRDSGMARVIERHENGGE